MHRIFKRSLHQSYTLSHMPTNFFQKSLPFLPKPSLDETLNIYLDVQKSLLDKAKYSVLEKEVKDYFSSNGRTLNDLLLKGYERDKFNYYGGYHWIDNELRDRSSILHRCGASGILAQTNENDDNQLVGAAKIIYLCTEIYVRVNNNTLEPPIWILDKTLSYSDVETIMKDVPEEERTQVAMNHKVIPYNMDRHMQYFGHARIPMEGKDCFTEKSDSRNVIVIRNGNLFSFDVIKENGSLCTVHEIYSNLVNIKKVSETPADIPIAGLTVLPRDEWAKRRNCLLTNEHNAKLLRKIENSIIVVSLDGKTVDQEIATAYLGQTCGDRWFDKSAQFAANEDGLKCFMGESTRVNGAIVVDIIARIMKSLKGLTILYNNCANSNPMPLEILEFVIDSDTLQDVEKAKKHYIKYKENFKSEYFTSSDIKRETFRARSLNSDSMVSLAIQMSLIKLWEKPCLEFANINMPHFANTNPATRMNPLPYVSTLAKSILDGNKINLSQLQSFSNVHVVYINEMRNGRCNAQDHLFALENLADNLGQYKDFFESELYKDSMHPALECANIPSEIFRSATFAPQTDKGLAFGYLFNENILGVSVLAYEDLRYVKEFSSHFLDAMHLLQWYASKI